MAACAMWKIDLTLTANTRSNSASETLSIGWLRWVQPALFTTMSSRPWAATTFSTPAATSRAAVTSPAIAIAFGPIEDATSLAPGPLRSRIATLAPSRAKVRAIPVPKPEAPPVTSATFPARRMARSFLMQSSARQLDTDAAMSQAAPLFRAGAALRLPGGEAGARRKTRAGWGERESPHPAAFGGDPPFRGGKAREPPCRDQQDVE